MNKNNIKITQDISASMSETISTDVENIIAALSIVLGNAFRFSPPNGEIKINVQEIDKEANQAMIIAVQDSGVGMHEEQIKNLSLNLLDFNSGREFIYHKPSVQLSRAKMCIEAFGGSLAIESGLGKGTTVKLTANYRLPEPSVNQEKIISINDNDLKLPSVKTKETLRAIDKPICSVLLVEDDDTTRYITYTKLADLGCEVDVAANGTEAVRMLTENDYDIALLDITLPDINGLEVMRQVRKTKEDKTIFVAVSSHSSPEDEEYMLTQGVMALIAKPVTEQQLKRVIDMVLNFKANE